MKEELEKRAEKLLARLEALHLDEVLRQRRNWKRRLFAEFLNGLARGVGFSVGFTVLGALLIAILRHIALSNLPLIGRFLADLVRIVENNL